MSGGVMDWEAAAADCAEGRRRLRMALDELNRLRSNIVATQSASWSNAMYPMVAILDRAGFERIDDVTPEDMADHMLCYGGAGGSPYHPLPDTRKGNLWRQRLNEARERGTALQRLHAGPQTVDEPDEAHSGEDD